MKNICLALALSQVHSLQVVQIIDSIVLEKEEYLELRNFNEATALSDDTSAFTQEVVFGITNNFENFKYDVFFFELDEDGNSDDLECYKKAVHDMKLWDKLDITHIENFKSNCVFDDSKSTVLVG